jgi:hypothetical protein
MHIRETKRSDSAQALVCPCTTLDLGLDGFRECPEVGPNDCHFAVAFGYGFLCVHPGAGPVRPTEPTGNPTARAKSDQAAA